MNRSCLQISAALMVGAWLPYSSAQNATQDRLVQAIEVAREDVQDATQKLVAVRDQVAAEQQPLAEELDALQREVVRLRRDADRLRTVRYQDDLEREALQHEVQRQQEEVDFIYTLLREYRRSFEVRQELAESHVLSPKMEEIDQSLADAKSPTSVISAIDTLLGLAEEWNRQKLGGASHVGACLDPDGRELSGLLVVLGPLSYFASDSGQEAGLVVSQLGSSIPSLFPYVDSGFTASIAALAHGQEARVPVDVSGGDALKVAAGKKTWKDHLIAGGFVMVPLLLIGLVAILLTVAKITMLYRIKTPDSTLLDRFVEHMRTDHTEEAEVLARSVNSPFDTVLLAAIEHQKLSRDHLEEILHERAWAAVPYLDRHLGMLAVLGGVAPLLGLLGTVTGMIHTFEMVTIFGTGDAKLLSGGISEALVTTETGLVIAVPVLLVHAFLTRRVRTLVAVLERTVISYLNRLHR